MKRIGLMLLFVAFGWTAVAQNETEVAQPKQLDEPTYKGGSEALMNFVAANVKYPKDAIESGTKGTVYTSILINESGEVIEVEILRGVSKSLDMEAIRVIESMPNWIPGKDEDGNPVKGSVTLPINFQL